MSEAAEAGETNGSSNLEILLILIIIGLSCIVCFVISSPMLGRMWDRSILQIPPDSELVPLTSFDGSATSLRAFGFTSCKTYDLPDNKFDTTCEQYFNNNTMAVIDFYAKGRRDKVYVIEAAVFQYDYPSNDFAVKVLSDIATIPIQGVNATEAQTWVAQNVPRSENEQTTVFGGVPFSVSGTPGIRAMKIGKETGE